MADDLRERLLTSYADMGAAMVARNVLEVSGVPCRIGDLAQLPGHLFGMGGGLGRSVGLWVLDVDVERAQSLLATGMTESDMDEEALAAEALAAAPTTASEESEAREEREAEKVVAPEQSDPPLVKMDRSPWFTLGMFALAAMAVLLAVRGCV